MKELINKVIEKLEEQKIGLTDLAEDKGFEFGIENAIEIIQKVVEEYNNGWIPCSEPPKTGEYVLLSFENFSVPLVGRYEEDDKGGAFYIGDEGETCVSQDMYVNAWQPLPEPYQPVSNDRTDAGTGYEKSAWRDLILRNFMRGSEA